LGMSVSVLRNLICWMMVVLCPLSLAAADTGSAVLHSEGGVWVNGLEVMGSSTVFLGDVLETKPGFVANLDAEGSAVLIQPESVVKFQGTFLDLEHGSVSVGTSTAMSVHAKCIRVDPVSNQRTQYDVTDASGRVQVAARKSDVNITQGGVTKKTAPQSSPSQSATVREGQQTTRDETDACGAAERPQKPFAGPDQQLLEVGGAAVTGIILCVLLCHGSQQSDASSWKP